MNRLAMLAMCLIISPMVCAQTDYSEHHGHEHDMQFDRSGMVMNANSVILPRGCEAISADIAFTVRAGTEYAVVEAGRVFGYSQYEFRVAPCSRVSVTFINEDQVRHQWMLHGLPRYLYPQGMFHLEASGGETVQGSFIVPQEDATYLVHCDVTQHMEKGMKAQLLVGKGAGNLWSIPELSADFKLSSNIGFIAYCLLFCSTVLAFSLLVWSVKKSRSTQ